jgi:hypothetical protein
MVENANTGKNYSALNSRTAKNIQNNQFNHKKLTDKFGKSIWKRI